MLDLLLAAGVNPNVGTMNGYTVLMHAAHKGDVEMVQKLIAWGASFTAAVHVGRDRGRTVQYFAGKGPEQTREQITELCQLKEKPAPKMEKKKAATILEKIHNKVRVKKIILKGGK